MGDERLSRHIRWVCPDGARSHIKSREKHERWINEHSECVYALAVRAVLDYFEATELKQAFLCRRAEGEPQFMLTLRQSRVDHDIIMPAVYANVLPRCPAQVLAIKLDEKIGRAGRTRKGETD